MDGDTTAAKYMEDSLARGPWIHEWGRHLFERARIAAYRGEREEAVVLFRDLLRKRSGVTLWMHYWPGMAPLREYPPFEALLREER
jgi:hypothetical protein